MQGPGMAQRISFSRIVWEELQPYEGRLGMSLRTALVCMLVVAMAMSQQVPEAALSCYLVFFASRDNAGSGLLIAIALIFAASLGILLGVMFLMLAADEPMLRLGLMALFTFGGMFLSQATRAGSIAATVGFVFAFVMTLYDFVPIPELLVRGLTWMWVVVFFPMAFLILMNATIGRNPAKLARHGIAARLDAVAGLLAGQPDALVRADKLLAEGTEKLETYVKMGKLLSLLRGDKALRLAELIQASPHLLLVARAIEHPEDWKALAPQVSALADAVRHDRLIETAPDFAMDISGSVDARALQPALVAVARPVLKNHVPQPPQHVSQQSSMLAPDAFTNPVYTQFALKVLLAVFITYLIYTTTDWFEIHTAMITCFYVALGSVGETMHKSILRIVGCLIGAAMGIASIYFLMPHMTDIGQLLLLVGAGSLVAAWVANGSSRIEYMGWQMALAFFLCILHGYGPSLDVNVAIDRIIGILIGNVVVAVIFSSLWPVSVGPSIANGLARALDAMRAALLGRPRADTASIAPAVAEARRLDELSNFEIYRVRQRYKLLEHSAEIAPAIERASAPFALLEAGRANGLALRGAPRCVNAATLGYETAVAAFLEQASLAIMSPDKQAVATVWQAHGRTEAALERLERLVRRPWPKRTRWWRELDETMTLYRRIASGLDDLVEAAR